MMAKWLNVRWLNIPDSYMLFTFIYLFITHANGHNISCWQIVNLVCFVVAGRQLRSPSPQPLQGSMTSCCVFIPKGASLFSKWRRNVKFDEISLQISSLFILFHDISMSSSDDNGNNFYFIYVTTNLYNPVICMLPDHMLCTEDAMECVSDIKVVYDCICSDHHPVSITIDTNIITITCSNNNEIKHHINWDKLHTKDVNKYRYSTGHAVDNISIPDGIKCVDPNYVNESHANDVADFYCNIIRILTECGSHLVSNVKGNNTQSQYNVPGWSDHVDSLHNAARDA